jgi:FkbM family methyltransferase
MKNSFQFLEKIIKSSETESMRITDYKKVYFLGDHSSSFTLRAGVISNRIDNFKGIVVGSLSNAKRLRVSSVIDNPTFWDFIEFDSLINSHIDEKILIIDFNDSLSGMQFKNRLQARGIHTVDYLKAMADLGLVHTYLPVNEERREAIENLREYEKVFNFITDPLSKATIVARLATIISLDRKYLLNISQNFGLFSRNPQSTSRIHVKACDCYVDVGAAHGDTVSEFFNATNGNYRMIKAFEPDKSNYASLSTLCNLLPNAEAFHAGLSDSEGQIEFYEDINNRFGSRFEASHSELPHLTTHQVRTFRLDDITDTASIIKIDVEGYESKVIRGATSIIQRNQPAMNVAGYHFPKDLFELINLVREIYEYKYVAIRHFGSAIYDTNILFSNSQSFYCE